MSTQTGQNDYRDATVAAAGMAGACGAPAPLIEGVCGQGDTALSGEGARLRELQSRHSGSHKPLEAYSEKVKVLLGWR